MEGLKDANVAVVMVPFPAQGHLNQLLHLSLLISSYETTVHYVGSTSHNRQAKLRYHGWDLERISSSKIHFHDIKIPPIISSSSHDHDHLNTSTMSGHFPVHLHPIFHTLLHLHQPVSQLLHKLAAEFRRVVVIYDSLMASVVRDVKSIPNAEAYTFMSSSAFTTFISTLDTKTHDQKKLFNDAIPTCIIPSFEDCFPPDVAKYVLYQESVSDFQSGRLHNTCRVIEGKYVELFRRLDNSSSACSDMKHFAIGPFNPVMKKTTSEKGRHRCLEWLDKQENNSVIYVSFGSTTTMTNKQIRELAIGLERSGHKFIWVLRDADGADIFADGQEGRKLRLPKGYEEKVKDRGIVIRDWAPQLDILAHSSTGGFMSHCGWNSCLESISMGVPIAAWPTHSDQPMNAVLLTDVLKIGTMVTDWANRAELTTENNIDNAVRRLMGVGF